MPDTELEHSLLAGPVTRDGATVHVDIYRTADGEDGGWILDVIDQNGNHTIWDEPFHSDQAALRAFESVLIDESIQSFIGPNSILH